MKRAIVPGLLVLALSAALPASAATLCVNPGGTGGCFSSIQAAVDASSSRDAIEIGAGIYVETVLLHDVGRLAIRGAGTAATVLEGPPGSHSTLGTFGRADVTLGGLEIRNGNHGISLGDYTKLLLHDAAVTNHAGAAIRTGLKSKLAIEDCVVAGNVGSSLFGLDAAIYSRGTSTTVVRSEIRDNDRLGISVDRKVTIVDSTIRNNGFGGVTADTGSITGSTISNNGAPNGDGVRVGQSRGGAFKIRNTTISGNAGIGLVVSARSAVTLDHVTIAGNTNAEAGAAMGGLYTSSPRVTLKATVIGDNLPNDCFSTYPGYEVKVRLAAVNLIETPAACLIAGVPPIVADPLLGPLQNNGGPTETRAPLPGSPAIGARTAGCSGVDQRGVARTKPCDLGAYETP